MMLFSQELNDFAHFVRRHRVAALPRIAHVGIAVPDIETALAFYPSPLAGPRATA
jgi:hypothetical protein